MTTAGRPPAPGFTLIELLVVLAIVATLLLLVAPRYLHKVDEAKEAVLRDNLRTVRHVIDQFQGDHGRYPDTLEELVERQYLRALPVDPMTESAATWERLAPPAGHQGAVYDIRSGAPGSGRDGRKYAEW
jgi:general secretion pathway protein G